MNPLTDPWYWLLLISAGIVGSVFTQVVVRILQKLHDNYKKSKQESKFYND